jgi:hypothetical protein
MLILHWNLSVNALRFHGRLQYSFAFTYSPMTWRRASWTFLFAGRKASGDTRRVAARAGSDCFFGLEPDSVRPCQQWCIQTRDLWSIYKNKRIYRGGREEGRGWPLSHPEEHGCRDACCKVSLLATKIQSCRPKEHKHSLKTKSNGAAPAHARSEVRRKRDRGDVVIDEKPPPGCG